MFKRFYLSDKRDNLGDAAFLAVRNAQPRMEIETWSFNRLYQQVILFMRAGADLPSEVEPQHLARALVSQNPGSEEDKADRVASIVRFIEEHGKVPAHEHPDQRDRVDAYRSRINSRSP